MKEPACGLALFFFEHVSGLPKCGANRGPEMRPGFYDYVYKAVRAYLVKSLQIPRMIKSASPVIFIANHEQSYGPVTAMASLPQPLVPWVTHEVTDKTLCPAYIEDDFVKPEVHVSPPLSTLVAKVVGRICVGIMHDLLAIPVYKQSRRIAETIRASVRYLEQGRRLLIFPEIPSLPFNNIICEFDTGFVAIARSLFERTRKVVTFLPVAVNRRLKSLRLGDPVEFDPFKPYHAERARIREELMERICEMYLEMEGIDEQVPVDSPSLV